MVSPGINGVPSTLERRAGGRCRETRDCSLMNISVSGWKVHTGPGELPAGSEQWRCWARAEIYKGYLRPGGLERIGSRERKC